MSYNLDKLMGSTAGYFLGSKFLDEDLTEPSTPESIPSTYCLPTVKVTYATLLLDNDSLLVDEDLTEPSAPKSRPSTYCLPPSKVTWATPPAQWSPSTSLELTDERSA